MSLQKGENKLLWHKSSLIDYIRRLHYQLKEIYKGINEGRIEGYLYRIFKEEEANRQRQTPRVMNSGSTALITEPQTDTTDFSSIHTLQATNNLNIKS